MPPTVRIKEH